MRKNAEKDARCTSKTVRRARLATLLREPLPAQALTITGLAKHLKTGRSVRIVGECGTGKTLMSIGVAHTHADGAPYSAIAMCPPHLVQKWAREVRITVPKAAPSLFMTSATVAKRFNPQTKHYESFLVTEAPDLPKTFAYAKERRLIEDIRKELRRGGAARYMQRSPASSTLQPVWSQFCVVSGYGVAVLRPSVPTLKRELWYERRLKEGVEVVICHPKLVETGLDLRAFG